MGSYSPSCLPPECYYIDSSSTSTAKTGTPQEPFQYLVDGFQKVGDRKLIIINYNEDVFLYLTRTFIFNTAVIVK